MIAEPGARRRALLSDYGWILTIVILAVAAEVLRGPLDWIGSKIALAFGNVALGIISTPPLQHFDGFHFMKIDWTIENSAGFASLFGTHLTVVIVAVTCSVLVALPIGFAVHRFRRAYLPTFVLLDAIYTVPSLAVFPILVQVHGLGIGDATAVVVIVAYAQFILVRNVFAGLDSVPAEVKESARGMGMSRAQILLHIEFPIALPVIVAGLRIATVAAIGIASIGALTGIQDLGSLLFSGGSLGQLGPSEVKAGAIGVIALALGADLMLRVIERFVPANRIARAGAFGMRARLFSRLRNRARLVT